MSWVRDKAVRGLEFGRMELRVFRKVTDRGGIPIIGINLLIDQND